MAAAPASAGSPAAWTPRRSSPSSCSSRRSRRTGSRPRSPPSRPRSPCSRTSTPRSPPWPPRPRTSPRPRGWSPSRRPAPTTRSASPPPPARSPRRLSFTVLGTARRTSSRPRTATPLHRRRGHRQPARTSGSRLDGVQQTISTGGGTLAGLVNADQQRRHAGVRASTVKLDDGTYRLLVESTTTGAASDFTLTQRQRHQPSRAARPSSRAGADASIKVGTDTIKSTHQHVHEPGARGELTLGFDAVGEHRRRRPRSPPTPRRCVDASRASSTRSTAC